MRITTLIENDCPAACKNLVAEWGLSLHICFGGYSILFDTGASGAFADNATFLNVDLAAVQSTVISHSHYDHGGGLGRFFSLNANAKVYHAKRPDGDCCAIRKGEERYIGLDKTLFTSHPHRFVTVHEKKEILPNVFLFPEICCHHPQPDGNKDLYIKKNGKIFHDDFSHELVMAIKEEDRIVIFTGCAHSGLLNMVDTVAQHFAGIPIKAVIGGFHLYSSPGLGLGGSKDEIEALGRAVLEYPVGMTYSGHCTGQDAFVVLQSVMGDRLVAMHTGSHFEV